MSGHCDQCSQWTTVSLRSKLKFKFRHELELELYLKLTQISDLICCTPVALSSLLMNPKELSLNQNELTNFEYLWQCLDVIQLSPYCMPLLIFFPVSLACKNQLLIEMKTDKKVCNKKRNCPCHHESKLFCRIGKITEVLFWSIFSTFCVICWKKQRKAKKYQTISWLNIPTRW